MAYNIIITPTAEKDIKKLDGVVKKRLKVSLEKFSQNPLSHAKRLTSPKIGTYRFRVGNYRIIFDINKNNIILLRIGHRRDIYR